MTSGIPTIEEIIQQINKYRTNFMIKEDALDEVESFVEIFYKYMLHNNCTEFNPIEYYRNKISFLKQLNNVKLTIKEWLKAIDQKTIHYKSDNKVHEIDAAITRNDLQKFIKNHDDIEGFLNALKLNSIEIDKHYYKGTVHIEKHFDPIIFYKRQAEYAGNNQNITRINKIYLNFDHNWSQSKECIEFYEDFITGPHLKCFINLKNIYIKQDFTFAPVPLSKENVNINWNGYYVLYCNKQDSIDQISQSQAKKVYLKIDHLHHIDPNNQSHNNLKNLDITHLIIECSFQYVQMFSIFSPEKKFEFVSLDTIPQDDFEFLKNINSEFLEIKKILLYPDLENIDLLDDILLNGNGSKHMKIRLQLNERSMCKNIFKLLPKFFTYAAFLNSSKSFASLKEYIDSAPQSFLSFCNILKEKEDIKNIISTHEKNDRTILLKIDHRMVFENYDADSIKCSALHMNAIETTISYYKNKSSLFFCFIESFYPFLKKTFRYYQEALLYLHEIEKGWLNYQDVFFKNNECVTSYDLKNHFVGAFIFGEYNNVFLKFELIKGD